MKWNIGESVLRFRFDINIIRNVMNLKIEKMYKGNV